MGGKWGSQACVVGESYKKKNQGGVVLGSGVPLNVLYTRLSRQLLSREGEFGPSLRVRAPLDYSQPG